MRLHSKSECIRNVFGIESNVMCQVNEPLDACARRQCTRAWIQWWLLLLCCCCCEIYVCRSTVGTGIHRKRFDTKLCIGRKSNFSLYLTTHQRFARDILTALWIKNVLRESFTRTHCEYTHLKRSTRQKKRKQRWILTLEKNTIWWKFGKIVDAKTKRKTSVRRKQEHRITILEMWEMVRDKLEHTVSSNRKFM